MKKLTRIIALALAILMVGTVAVFASGTNIVISLSYLTDTFLPQLTGKLSGKADDLDEVYDSAVDQLKDKTGQTLADPSWNLTESFEMVYPKSGETVTLGAGSGILWNSGTAAASSVLLDVTVGTELSSGASLTAGHRYLAEQVTVITAVSASSCGVEGQWKTTATGTAPVQLPFKDVTTGDWYYDAVCFVVEKGLFNGTTTTTFEPNSEMNRAMLATVLYRIDGKPAVSGANPFVDVSAGEWYAPQVLWAYWAGVVTGTSATTFGPMETVTREQIAVLLYRYSIYRGYDVSARASVTGFSDYGRISTYALDGISWAVAEGLLVGSDGKLDPGSGATRAQVATILQRYSAWVGRQ